MNISSILPETAVVILALGILLIDLWTPPEMRVRLGYVAALGLLKDIHDQIGTRLKGIDALLRETNARERALSDGTFRARIRKETKAWFETHPDQARAIADLFGQDIAP